MYGELGTRLKNKFHNSIRFKFALSLSISVVLMILIEYSIVLVIFIPNKDMSNWITAHLIIFYLIAVLVFVFGTICIFMMITQRSMKYFGEILSGIENVSKGDLNTSISVKGSDELAQLAYSINIMADKLYNSIEKERNIEKVKSELINNISHDLRTPLTSVLGYLELIKNSNYNNKELINKHVNVVYRKCKDISTLVDDLFEFSNLSYKDIKLNKEKLNLYEIIQQVVMEFIPIMDNRQMHYKISCITNQYYVFSDAKMMVRLFENLISNAIRYGKENTCIEIEIILENEEVITKIINFGEEIPKEDLTKIFEKFYRVEKSRSQNTGGTGLGLAIAKSIVDLHQGEIRVSSSNSKTIFEVAFKEYKK